MSRIVGLLIALFVASAIAGELYAIRGLTAQQQRSLIGQGLDVRGTFGVVPGFTLIQVSHALQSLPANWKHLGELSGSTQVVISEHISSNATLLFEEMQACAQIASVYCMGDACVSIVPLAHEHDFFGCISGSVELVSMPPSAISLPASQPVPLHETMANSPVIEALLKQVDQNSLRSFLMTLTGFNTRQSQSTTAVDAAAYILKTFQQYGLNATSSQFRTGYSNNVVGEIRGSSQPDKIVIIGAHYDCRMATLSSTTARAPGANDDGSGTAALLEFARILGSQQPALKIPYTIRLCAFSGEEQGLYGSTAYATDQKSRNVDIVAMLQGDMIAYQQGTALGLDLTSRYTTPALNTQLNTLIKSYVPELVLGTNSGCCSDQQPFFDRGYAAAAFIHQGGAGVDPQYHQTGDVVDRPKYSLPLVQAISRAILAGALTVAGVA